MRKSVEERFWSKVKMGEPDECWEWQAYFRGGGYGGFQWLGKPWKSHRVAWILTNGEVPDGLWVLHTCDNPACCNPAHLWLGTRSDNVRDMCAKGRGGGYQGRQVRTLYADGNFSQELLAEIFGIPIGAVQRYIDKK